MCFILLRLSLSMLSGGGAQEVFEVAGEDLEGHITVTFESTARILPKHVLN